METHNHIEPILAISPGELILDEIQARGWTQRKFAEILGVPTQSVNAVIRGHREITPEFALKIAAALDTPANTWLRLDADYRALIAKQRAVGLDEIRNRAKLAS